MDVRFFGVRGSTPCSHESARRYGGNTSCVVLEASEHDPIIFDLGTGLRYFGETMPRGVPASAHALLTHLHWDHVQGLPFCASMTRPDASLVVYGPADGTKGIGDAFGELVRPPFFPVGVSDFAADIRFSTVGSESFEIGRAVVRARWVPHTGPTLGFRVELDGASVAYIPDHQQPLDGSMSIAQSVLELADGVDLLIHDSQFTNDEFAVKAHWGHSTIDYALHVAREAGARRLALFHHDPAHDDLAVDLILEQARDSVVGNDLGEIVAASEGLIVPLGTVMAAR